MSEHQCVRFHLLNPDVHRSSYGGMFINTFTGVLRCQDCGAEYPYPEEVEGWYGFTDGDSDDRRKPE